MRKGVKIYGHIRSIVQGYTRQLLNDTLVLLIIVITFDIVS